MKKRSGHLFKRNGIFWLRWTVNDKRSARSLETRDKREAESAAAKHMDPIRAADEVETLRSIKGRLEAAEVTAASLADEVNPPLTLAQAWAAYVEAENRPQSGPRTLSDYEGYFFRFAAWMKTEKPEAALLRDVTHADAAAFVRHLAGLKLSGNTVNKNLAFLKTLFHTLREPGKITANPFDEIARRKQVTMSRRPLTIEELKKIIETATGELQTLFMLGTFTGLRLGDAATLRWDETDLARKIIRRIPNKTARTGAPVILGLPEILVRHLDGLKRRGPFVMPGIAREYAGDCSPLCNKIQAHLKNCGIETTKPGTGPGTGKRAVTVAGFHSLRHSFVSLHAQAGTPQAILQKMAGHSNPMMTEHYTHINEAAALSAAAALPAILGEAKPVRALPPAALAARVRALAERLTAKNAGKVRAELLALAG